MTRFGAVFSAKAFERQLGEFGAPIAGRLGALELLSIAHGAIRREQSYPLGG